MLKTPFLVRSSPMRPRVAFIGYRASGESNAQFPELIPASDQVAGEAMPDAVERLLNDMTRDLVCLTRGCAAG